MLCEKRGANFKISNQSVLGKFRSCFRIFLGVLDVLKIMSKIEDSSLLVFLVGFIDYFFDFFFNFFLSDYKVFFF